jgi:DNA primase
MDVKDVIERINDDIVEIVSHFVELKQHGRNHQGCCPFHNEKTPSFVVSPQKGIYKCFGCGAGGDAIHFIMEHEHIEFKEAIAIGAKKLKIDFEWREQRNFNDAEYQHKESLRIVCVKAAAYFQQCITKNLVAANYVKNRKFDISDPDDPFQIGYAPAGNTLLKWAQENTINVQLLIEAGLVGVNDKGDKYDFFRDRIMFPICNKTGKVIGFTGRALTDKKEVAKYLNSPDTDIFNKGRELFALNIARHAIRKENRVYMVEGNFDVKRLHSITVQNTVAPCGTSLTVDQARLLREYTKNITLIYDGDEAGRKAIERNGDILVKEQFNVMVMQLPDGEDPDTVFTTIETFEEFKEKHQIDYIIYKVQNGVSKCQNPAYKSDFIKEIASLITRYDEPSLHEVYIDSVSSIIKPKKAWQDQIRSFVADKAPVEKKRSYIPKNITADELLETGFYAENNCYYFTDKKGDPHQRSNFTLVPIFHIDSLNAKRLYEVKNITGITRVIEIAQKDLCSLTSFQVVVESLGNFWFDGSQADLNRLKRWLYENTESCKEVKQLGWQKEGYWAWGNGIFNTDFVPVDDYGIVRNGKSSFYIPAYSQIFKNEDNLYQFERRFIHMEGNITLKEYAKKYVTVFGDNAKIALCYYFAAIFRDIIVRRFGIFPVLNMFGPKGAGKTKCAESLIQFFGRLSPFPNIHNTSKPALADHVASSFNAICGIDEYRNDLEMEKREFLKGLWDGTGRTRMNMDKDKKKETTSVDQAVILCGQQMATADIALFSRLIFLSFTQTEYTDEERENFNNLKEIEKRGLTHITHQILRLRSVFHDNFNEGVKKASEKMREKMRSNVVEDRIFNNWLIPLAAYYTLSESFEIPWDIDELTLLAVTLMIKQNKETKKNDDLGNFWKVVQFMASSNMLFEDGDYKIVIADRLTVRYFKNGEWGKDEIKFEEPTQLFYLTTSRVFSLYKSQCLREGDKPMPDSTVEYYLVNSPAFIAETKKESFKKIDPKTGQQEEREIVDAGGVTRAEKKYTSTTALVFNYAKLGLTITSPDKDDNIPTVTTSDQPEAIQNDLPF